MGNSLKRFSNKNSKNVFCSCLCTSDSLTNSYSSYSTDEKYFPTFDRLISNDKNHNNLLSFDKTIPIYYSQSNEDIFESFDDTITIDQWLYLLPILDQTYLNKTIQLKQYQTIINSNLTNDNQQLIYILNLKLNRNVVYFIKKCHLNFYLKDFRNRLNKSHMKQTFKEHFQSTKIIYPCNGLHRNLTDDLNLFFISPPESIIPDILVNSETKYQIHEQIRSKCYIVPLKSCLIKYDEYILSECKQNEHISKMSTENDISLTFSFNNSYETGFICVDKDKISKEFQPFIHKCSKENKFYLSSNLIQQWFDTLILVNQTCSIVQRFLKGNSNYITFLLKHENKTQLNNNNQHLSHQNLTFAALRLSSFAYMNSGDNQDDESEKIIDVFSSTFLSFNKIISTDSIHVDYEQYSFAFFLDRWPKALIDVYYTHPNRYSKRQWPSKSHMNIILNKSLLLIPNIVLHQWKINYDLIEQYLFEIMNESTLFFYILCQQLFSSNDYSMRQIIKHCFLNYCEKYGLPLSNNQTNIMELIKHFSKELNLQIKDQFIPNYFNHNINLLDSNIDYSQWFDFIDKNFKNSIDLSLMSVKNLSNRPVIIEYLFYFIEQLYKTFEKHRSDFHLNDKILLDKHVYLFENFFNERYSTMDNFDKKKIIEHIQMHLTYDFEINAESVHICLNQIRRAQSSLIFHYIWTIFIQYLHTYINVLWNI